MDSGGPKEPCSLRGRILPGEGAILGVAGFLKSIVGNSELQITECGLTLNYFDHLLSSMLCIRFCILLTHKTYLLAYPAQPKLGL